VRYTCEDERPFVLTRYCILSAIVSAEQQAEQTQTFNILPIRPFAVLKAHTSLLLSVPIQYWQAIKLTWRSQSAGLKALLYQFLLLH
jgi:hypothetical protein